MVARIAPIIVAAVVTIILGFVMFLASGAPTAPTTTFNQQLTVGTAQTIQVPITVSVYSTVSPNSIGWIGNTLIYTATASLSNGATPTVLSSSQSTTLNLISQSGSGLSTTYVLGATLSLAIPALCASGIVCAGYTENITIVSYGLVGLLSKTQGPASTIVLSTNPNYQTSPVAPVANPALFYLEFWGSLTAITTTWLWALYISLRNPVFLIAVVPTILLIPMFILW